MNRLLFFLLLLPTTISAQTKTVKGIVKDELGIGFPGVTIQIKEAQNLGTITDFDGNFEIKVPSEGTITLVLSYIGYKTKEINTENKIIINTQLEVDTTQLGEVVIVGYGNVLKRDITGSVVTVKVKEDIANQSNSVEQLLQGRASGVQVIQNGGAVGSGISVKIRGTNSLRGNNEPLYVIDGVIISSAGDDVLAVGVGSSGQETQNGLNGINPRDIEDIQVLKDASATAIYGSRGANGVIIITTKKGVKGKVRISAFANYSIREIDNKYDVLDAVGYANYVNDTRSTLGIVGSNGALPLYQINGTQIYGISYDAFSTPTVSTTPAQTYSWQDELYRFGYSNKFGTSASGGNDKGNYYISAGFDDQQGIVKNSSFRSSDLRINLNQDLNTNLTLETRIAAFFSDSNFSEGGDLIGGSNQSFVKNAIAFRPVIIQDIEDIEQDLEISNPYSWINDFEDASKENRYIGAIGLTYKLPIKGLSYKVKFGGNIRTKERRRFFGLSTFQGEKAGGALQISTLKSTSYQFNNLLRYRRTFNNKHRINAVLGTTYDVRNVEKSIYAVEDFVTTQLTIQQPALGSVISQPLTYFKNDQQIFSVLGRLNYTFNNKYVLTASFRRDGVSKFFRSNKYGFFPSFAFAWRADNEQFIKKLNIFKELKFRTGWGQIGNHGINAYGTTSNYGASGLYGNSSGTTNVPIALLNLANPDLTWETLEQINFGLDFTTKNRLLSGTIDVYTKTTKDLLINRPISASAGVLSGIIPLNQGDISNKGLEISLQLNAINTRDFKLNLGGNIGFNKTKITSLGIPLSDLYIDGSLQQKSFYHGRNISQGSIFKSPANIFVQGEEIGLFYGLQTDGIYQTGDTDIPEIYGTQAVPGDVRLVDQNADGLIDENDRTFIGNPNPDFVYGFNLSAKYKNFSATFLLNGVYGNDIANGNLIQLNSAEGLNSNILPEAYNNAWTPTNASNTHPRIGYKTNGRTAISDRIIEDGSYLRLSNISFGYDIPVENSTLFDKVNLYISGQNLFTWTDYSGYNPEVTSFLSTSLITGVDWNGSPNAKTVLLGININF